MGETAARMRGCRTHGLALEDRTGPLRRRRPPARAVRQAGCQRRVLRLALDSPRRPLSSDSGYPHLPPDLPRLRVVVGSPGAASAPLLAEACRSDSERTRSHRGVAQPCRIDDDKRRARARSGSRATARRWTGRWAVAVRRTVAARSRPSSRWRSCCRLPTKPVSAGPVNRAVCGSSVRCAARRRAGRFIRRAPRLRSTGSCPDRRGISHCRWGVTGADITPARRYPRVQDPFPFDTRQAEPGTRHALVSQMAAILGEAGRGRPGH